MHRPSTACTRHLHHAHAIDITHTPSTSCTRHRHHAHPIDITQTPSTSRIRHCITRTTLHVRTGQMRVMAKANTPFINWSWGWGAAMGEFHSQMTLVCACRWLLTWRRKWASLISRACPPLIPCPALADSHLSDLIPFLVLAGLRPRPNLPNLRSRKAWPKRV